MTKQIRDYVLEARLIRESKEQKNEADAVYPVYIGIAGPNAIATGSSLEFDKWLKYMKVNHPSVKIKKEIKNMTVDAYKKFVGESLWDKPNKTYN